MYLICMCVIQWDISGPDRYRSLLPVYWRRASALLLMYDITCAKTFQGLDSWMRDAHNIFEPEDKVLIYLLGCKLDSSASEEKDLREVPREQAEAWAKENDIAGFFEVSAKTGENVELVLETLVTDLGLGYGGKLLLPSEGGWNRMTLKAQKVKGSCCLQ